MDFLIKAAQLLLSLSLLVALHELGHFLPARFFKIRVEKFYLFFNPWFSIAKKQIGETEWGIGWLPLGGYVKIAGMVDESMDKEQMALPPQPWEFRSKPAWQRLIVMIGGVTVNLILGVLIYIGVLFTYGVEKMAPQDLSAGLSVHPILNQYGFTSGDVILSSEGTPITNAKDVNKEIMLRGARVFEVQHLNGAKETLTLPEDIDYTLFKAGAMSPFDWRMKSNAIDSVFETATGTAKGVLFKNDKFITIANQPIEYFDETVSVLYKNRGKKIAFSVLRGSDTLTKNLLVSAEGTIGFKPLVGKIMVDPNKLQDIQYGFGESIVKGTAFGMSTLGDYVGQLKYLFTKKGATSLGGFGAIGSLFPATWDWEIFWLNTALISIILAFMNILPIPALDGGHVVFLLYEMITGKEAPQKVLEYAQYVGFILLLTLMLYANGNDVYKAFFS
ncbi:MAG: regulator of sigma E protease [Lentimonas sp.]|jgi:regulator of sigma E protease